MEKKRPNVIIFNPDEMRADSMRHMGNEAAYTPYLDQLAEEGVSFSNAVCQNPVCVPSRCSFLTGTYPHTLGHRTQGHMLHPHEENIFGDMKKAGYYTISSTRGDFMAGQYRAYHKELIDEYIIVPKPEKPLTPAPARRGEPDSDTYFSMMNGIIPSDRTDENVDNMDDLTVAGAIRSIKKRPKDKPFFMFVGLMYPHPPYQIEQKYFDLIDQTKLPPRIPNIKETDGKPAMERSLEGAQRLRSWSEERLNELRAVYLGMCAKIDDQLGRLIGVLKKEGIYDDTVILFLSDHGDYAGDYGLVEKAQNCFPECLVKVPLLVKPQKGVRVDTGINRNLVELTDVCATVAELTGVPINRSHFSKSLVKTMQDKKEKHRSFTCCEGGRLPGESHCAEFVAERFDKNDVYAPRMLLQAKEDGTHGKAVMIRNEAYKYVRRMQEKDEFYVLADGECVNRIDDPQFKEIQQTMQMQMLDWYMETCDIVPYKVDERFTIEFLTNNMVATGKPPVLGKMLDVYLRLTGKTIGEFIDSIRIKAENNKKR